MTNLIDEYDMLVYPGFLRRNVAKWNEDGSFAPLARARGPKGDTFVLQLKSVEVDQDITEIELELGLSKKHSKNR
jgi:hypothetical protein